VAVVQYTFTHKQSMEQHRTTQLTNWEECGPCPVFGSYTLAFALQLSKKHGKTSVSGSGPVEAIGILQMVQEHTTASC